MAATLTIGRFKTITLGTTCTRLDGISGCQWLTILPTIVDVYIVDDPTVADGAAVPSDRGKLLAGSGVTLPLRGPILLAAASAVDVTVRSL